MSQHNIVSLIKDRLIAQPHPNLMDGGWPTSINSAPYMKLKMKRGEEEDDEEVYCIPAYNGTLDFINAGGELELCVDDYAPDDDYPYAFPEDMDDFGMDVQLPAPTSTSPDSNSETMSAFQTARPDGSHLSPWAPVETGSSAHADAD
jgi:hypothetical protein